MRRPTTIHTELAPNLPVVEADAVQIHQVLKNLLVNAAEAIGEADGTITITTDLRQLTGADLARALVGADRPPGWYVALAIADTGGGMDQAILVRIFEPFFTTKFTGRGLGLPAVLGIIRQHRGALMVQSTAGQGTTFSLFLPCARARSATLTAAAPAASSGPRTVLVVDDEDHTRSTMARLLERLGCAVITAADGRAGLEIFQAHRYTIDCVLLDLTMPGMDSAAVAHAMRRLDPDIPLIVMSGYSKEEVAASLVAAARMYTLSKPFQLDDLQQLLQQAIQQEAREMGG